MNGITTYYHACRAMTADAEHLCITATYVDCHQQVALGTTFNDAINIGSPHRVLHMLSLQPHLRHWAHVLLVHRQHVQMCPWHTP